MNRPPANAIDLELAERFEAALDEAMKQEPAALVLTGTGGFFSGGLNLKTVPAYPTAKQRSLLLAVNRMIGRLYACPIPVVGGINGHAVAGGLIVALTADYRVGPTGNAQFGLTEARVGIPFPAATMIVLHAELAPQDLRYITLYARSFGPEKAQARGILDELQEPTAVLERAIELATEMASIPSDAYARIKRQVRGAAIAQIEELNASGSEPMLEGWISPGAQDASAAVLKDGRRT
jgi:enoyl-CoA hydratase